MMPLPVELLLLLLLSRETPRKFRDRARDGNTSRDSKEKERTAILPRRFTQIRQVGRRARDVGFRAARIAGNLENAISQEANGIRMKIIRIAESR